MARFKKVAASALKVDKDGKREFGEGTVHDTVDPEKENSRTYPARFFVDNGKLIEMEQEVEKEEKER